MPVQKAKELFNHLIMDRKQQIETFFKVYAQRFNDAIHGKKPDIEGVADSFATSFIEASPVGIIAGANDKKFKEMIPKGYEFYVSTGIKTMEIISKEITFLDDRHSMVKVYWNSKYEREDASEVTIAFDVFYLLQEINGQLKIFSYITGDEEKVLKDNGIKPYK